jgi:hypothetical protein
VRLVGSRVIVIEIKVGKNKTRGPKKNKGKKIK